MTEHVEPEWAMVTAMFVDVRGFTSFADRATAREAVGYLNDFFAAVLPVLTRHGGRAQQLLGDGVLAIFGAPGALADHADRALAAAIAIAAEVDARLGERCRIGIGINSGLVLVGTIGAGETHALSVIGDPVNVAARVQDATRRLAETVLLTEATRCLLDASHPRLEARGPVALKGKRHPVPVYAPLVTRPGRSSPRTPLACPP